MNMEMSRTLSMLIIGANHPVVRKRGYEITKKVRAMRSPKSSSRELIRSACGAITSCRSRTPAEYISCGSIGRADVSASDFLLLNRSRRDIRIVYSLQFTVDRKFVSLYFCIVLLSVNCQLFTAHASSASLPRRG